MLHNPHNVNVVKDKVLVIYAIIPNVMWNNDLHHAYKYYNGNMISWD
jgi:hypothetical protein